MSRIYARKCVFIMVYEKVFAEKYKLNILNFFDEENKEPLQDIYKEIGLEDSESQEYCENFVKNIISQKTTLEDIIKSKLTRFPIEKILSTDLAILLCSVYELLYDKSTSVKVIVNEAVKLAKTYSDDNSYKFVNGVLSSIIKDIDSGKYTI